MKKTIIVYILTLFAYNSYCQVFSDSIYFHLSNFLQIKGEFEDEDILKKDMKDYIIIKNLVDSTNNNFGIYYFYKNDDTELRVNFFIIKEKQLEIIDINEVNTLYERIAILFEEFPSFFDRNNIIIYLNKTTELIMKYSANDLNNIIIKFDYGNFSYYIDKKNIVNPKGHIKYP